ncbi:hypothetical protein CIB84_012245 [Bambusicola thoracicus]|uniref:Uncharacterized protein n=1 Tax=Bambusicola thoracicus TaxID=9083 RepID=A0A2P4SIS2_BAMTH|nr:hypothetical protein CIB84_012245 [Bambusicola thoracicus]
MCHVSSMGQMAILPAPGIKEGLHT